MGLDQKTILEKCQKLSSEWLWLCNNQGLYSLFLRIASWRPPDLLCKPGVPGSVEQGHLLTLSPVKALGEMDTEASFLVERSYDKNSL